MFNTPLTIIVSLYLRAVLRVDNLRYEALNPRLLLAGFLGLEV